MTSNTCWTPSFLQDTFLVLLYVPHNNSTCHSFAPSPEICSLSSGFSQKKFSSSAGKTLKMSIHRREVCMTKQIPGVFETQDNQRKCQKIQIINKCVTLLQSPATNNVNILEQLSPVYLERTAPELILSPRSHILHQMLLTGNKNHLCQSLWWGGGYTYYEQTNIYTQTFLLLHYKKKKNSQKVFVHGGLRPQTSHWCAWSKPNLLPGYGWSGGLAAVASSLLLSTSCSMGLSSSSCWLV